MKPLHPFFCLAALLAAGAAAAPQHYQGCLNGAGQAQIMLDSGNQRYFEGRIRFKHMDFSRTGATLYASADNSRALFRNQTGEQTFLLWLPPTKPPLLTLEAAAQPELCYELSLNPQAVRGYLEGQENDRPQSPRLQALQQTLQAGQAGAKLAAFWQQIKTEGTPLVEPLDGGRSLLTFLWRGGHNVRLIGGPGNDREWLQRLPRSDIWFKSFIVQNDVRLSYQLAPDIPKLLAAAGEDAQTHRYRQRRALLATLQADPLNPRRFADASLLDLNPDSRLSDGLNALKGRLKAYGFASTLLGNQRRIWVYQTDPDVKQPAWLYLFDGNEYLHQVQAPAIFDRLRRSGKIPPLVAVFIDNAGGDSRRNELPANPRFADMLAQELIPFVERQTGLQHNSRRSVLAGSSYGGLAAAYAASRQPQYFSGVLPMSGSFWWHPPKQSGNGMAEQYERLPMLPLRWFIGAGRYETARSHEDADILNRSRTLADTLQRKGYTVTFREYPGGHDYAIWQQMLADGLSDLLAPK